MTRQRKGGRVGLSYVCHLLDLEVNYLFTAVILGFTLSIVLFSLNLGLSNL